MKEKLLSNIKKWGNHIIWFPLFFILSCRTFVPIGTLPVPSQKSPPKHQFNKEKKTDFSIFLNQYVHQTDILRELGDSKNSFGLNVKYFGDNKDPTIKKSLEIGIDLTWTFDHFIKTNSKLLKTKFFGDNYTNYILGAGLSLKKKIHKRSFIVFTGGVSIHFLEIDTFRNNNNYNDSEFKDTSVGVYQKAELHYNINKINSIYLGVLSYWMPTPLSNFANEDLSISTKQSGGNVGIFIGYSFNSI